MLTNVSGTLIGERLRCGMISSARCGGFQNSEIEAFTEGRFAFSSAESSSCPTILTNSSLSG